MRREKNKKNAEYVMLSAKESIAKILCPDINLKFFILLNCVMMTVCKSDDLQSFSRN